MKDEYKDKILMTFIEIFKDFVCVRSFITVGAFGIAYYLMLTSKPIPDLLMSIVDLLLGFWFGQKVAQAQIKVENQTNGGTK